MIASFKYNYAFLSNFWPVEITLDGKTYPSVEHAYQAAKTTDQTERDDIRRVTKAGVAKKLGKAVTLRHGWDDIKLETMRALVWQKFENPYLREKLLATGDQPLIEGNTWGDTFWGVCDGVGENHLGLILMNIRDRVRERAAK